MAKKVQKKHLLSIQNGKKRKRSKGIKTMRQKNASHYSFYDNNLKKLQESILKVGAVSIFFGNKILLEILSFILFVRDVFIFPLKKLKKIIPRKQKALKRKTRKVVKETTSFIYKFKYIAIGTFLALVFFFIPLAFFIFISDLPKLSNLTFKNIPKSTKILDRNGELLYEIYSSQNRTIVPLSKVPQDLREATISIEDKDFYNHSGFDLKGMARAFYVNLRHKKTQGGSTITQQLIKSALLTPEPTIIRKTRELVLAFWAEREYSKDEILELYFNYIPYGGTAWGIQAASNVYFGKDVSELNLAESAFLAGLPQAPGEYNPFAGDGKSGKKRQKEVLSAMADEGYITREEKDRAYKEKLNFKSGNISIRAPHFVMYVKDLLVKKYGLYEVEMGGLQVITSLDLKTQEHSENIVASEVKNSEYLGVGNGAALVTNPKNGDILAMVGSQDYFDSEKDGNVNITTSFRQPGSSIKIIPYTLALTKGYTEATILDDTPLTIHDPYGPPYTPVNYDGAFHGRVPLRIAFANSYNIPAVRVAQKLGVNEIVEFGNKMGIASWKNSNDYGVSIALGAGEVSMVELSTAYGVIANGGEKVDVNPILEVKDSEGKVLYEKEISKERVVDSGIAFIISDILADNRARSMAFGPNTPLVIPNQRVSVKTGTTDNKRDNWTVGFTPDIVVATWVGNNDNTPLSQYLASGITGAAPIWNRIMTKMLEGKSTYTAVLPSNVTSLKCYGYDAYFVKGTESAQCKSGNFGPKISPTPIKEFFPENNNRGRRKRFQFEF